MTVTYMVRVEVCMMQMGCPHILVYICMLECGLQQCIEQTGHILQDMDLHIYYGRRLCR